MSTTKTNEITVNNTVNETVNETAERNNNLSYKDIIKNLLAQGVRRINKLRVKNVNCTPKDNYVMVSFTIDGQLPAYVSEDNGITFTKGLSNIIYTSNYGIIGAMKENEDLSWLANYIKDAPKALNVLFNGGYIDVLQQEVSSGEEYINPFSNKEGTVFDHDVIINHVINLTLSKTGRRAADALMLRAFEEE